MKKMIKFAHAVRPIEAKVEKSTASVESERDAALIVVSGFFDIVSEEKDKKKKFYPTWVKYRDAIKEATSIREIDRLRRNAIKEAM